MVGYVYTLIGDLAEAEDTVQEAYARAWQHWPKVSRYENPEAWVRTVSYRIAVSSRLRAMSRQRARRIRHRVGTAALSAGAVGLTAVGVAAVVGNGGLGGDRMPLATSPPTATTSPTEARPLPSASAHISEDGGDSPATHAGQLIAYFPSRQAAMDANGTVFQWQETCGIYLIGLNGDLRQTGGGLVTDTVQQRGPERLAGGAAWQLMFDDGGNEHGWFDSIGVGFVEQPYLTIVSYGDWGRDANYLPEDNPGMVLLQDAFDRLPS